MRTEIIPVFFNHLARHRTGNPAIGQVEQEDVFWLGQLDLPGVAIKRAQAFQRRIVIKLVGLARLGDIFIGAGNHAFHLAQLRGRQARVHQSLHGVHIILGHQLALFAIERRVVGEINAGLDAQGDGLEVGGDFRHFGQRVRHELQRSRQIVIGQR